MLLNSLYICFVCARFRATGRRKKPYTLAKMRAQWIEIYTLFWEQAFQMHAYIWSHHLLFWSQITYAEISAKIKRFLSLEENMMDGNERTSVHPYGREVKFSVLQMTTFQKQCCSLFAAPVSQAKHLQPSLKPLRSQVLSLISGHSPQRKHVWDADPDVSCWLPCIWKLQITDRGFSPFFFRKSRHFSKGSTEFTAKPNI